ncbi:MAG: PilZ domain-containing protein [Chloroflexi bacterium]|nr:PilZ domain-containing protein [Chloroflexota bacterium]
MSPKVKTKVAADSRQTYRKNVKLLVAFRCDDPSAPIQDGFARAVSLSDTGALLELPDLYKVGNEFQLEFLLNDNLIAPVKGTVTRIDKRKDFYEVAVEFSKVPAKVKHLIREQTDG